MFNLFRSSNSSSKRPPRSFLIFAVVFLSVLLPFQNCSGPAGLGTGKFKLHNGPGSLDESSIEIPVSPHTPITKMFKTTFTLSLSDRNYIAGILSDIFGPESEGPILEFILSKHAFLGGACNELDQYKIQDPKSVKTKLIVHSESLNCALEDRERALVPPPMAVRQGLINQVCATLVGKEGLPNTLAHALGRITSGANFDNPPPVNRASFAQLHRLFYRARPLPPESVFDSLKMFFKTPESPTTEEWKMAINSYCISSQWQIL